MSENLRLGKIIDGGRVDRDAIHIAVMPVVAGEKLQPGTHVGFAKGGYRVTASPSGGYECVGIVDPYLQRGSPAWFPVTQAV